MKRFVLMGMFVLACSKATPPPEVITDAKPPPDLVAALSAPSFSGALERFRNFMDAVQPGRSAMMTDGMLSIMLAGQLGVGSLDGVDLSAPVHLLLADAKKHEKPIVMLGRVKNEAAVRQGAREKARFSKGWVLLGDPPAATALAPYAFSLAEAKLPADVTVMVPVQNLLALYRVDIENAKRELSDMTARDPAAGSMAKTIDWTFDFMLAAMEQTDRAVVTVRADARALGIDFALVPRADTTFQKFVAHQKPSDYALVAKLPAGPSDLVLAGRFDAGPAGPAIYGAMDALLASAKMDARWSAVFRELMAVCEGEFAALADLRLGQMERMVEVIQVTDPTAATRAVQNMLDLLAAGKGYELFGIRVEYLVDPASRSHDGVAYRGYETRTIATALPTPPPPTRTRIAVVDQVLALAIGPVEKDEMPQVIDAVRGNDAYAPSPAVQAAFDESRRSKETLFFFMDLKAMTSGSPSSTGVSMGMGFTGGAAHFRIGLPAQHLAEMAAGQR